MEWLGSQGYKVWIPVGHGPDIDLIAEDTDERLLRVQVKTTRFRREDRVDPGRPLPSAESG